MFTLTGTLQDHGGQPLAGATLVITASPFVTVDHAGDVIHLGGIEVTTDETGYFTTELVTLDLGDGERPVYTVRTTHGSRLRPVRFMAPEDGVTVDLADVTPVPAVGPYVEYVKGDPGPPGVSDHGALTGLGDDDHPQYLTEARGDARYDATGTAAALVGGLSIPTTPQDIGAQPAGDYAAGTHNHDGTYQPVGDYATRDELPTVPDVSDVIREGDPRLTDDRDPTAHNHSIGDVTGLQGALDGKSAIGHDHDGIYQPAGDYAAGTHTHAEYVETTDPRLTDARTPTAHDHAIGDVTGLQAELDGKQPAGSYAPATHDHDDRYYTEGEVDAALSGKAATVHSHVAADVTDLGTAATTDAADYATAAQGSLADTAVQPGDDAGTLGSGAASAGQVLTADGSGAASWETGGGGSVFDTGWRDVTADLDSRISSGHLLIRRFGSVVYLGGNYPIYRTSSSKVYDVPIGFGASAQTSLPSQGGSGSVGVARLYVTEDFPFDVDDPGAWPPGFDIEDPDTWPEMILRSRVDAVGGSGESWEPGGSWVTDDPEPDPQDWPGTPWPAP